MNNTLTSRQIRRSMLLSVCIPGVLFLPVIHANIPHGMLYTLPVSLCAELILGSLFIYFAKRLHCFSGVQAIDTRLIHLVYAIRFFIRAACMLSIFTDMVSRFLLPDKSRIALLLPAILALYMLTRRQLYGQSCMLELLFWWLLFPIAILFIGSIADWHPALAATQSFAAIGLSLPETLYRSYESLMLILPLEGILYLLPKCPDNMASTHAFRGLWLGLALCLLAGIAAFFTAGEHALHTDYLRVFTLLQTLPINGVLGNRIDILILLFLLAGFFVLLSNTTACGLCALNQSASPHPWTHTLFCLGLLLVVLFMTPTQTIMTWYIRYACLLDIPLSILLPLLGLLSDSQKKTIKHTLTGCLFLMLLFLTGCHHADMEDHDYTLMLSIDPAATGFGKSSWVFGAAMADMQGYHADIGENVKMKSVIEERDSLSVFCDSYTRTHATRMHLGHTKLLLLQQSILESPGMLASLLDTLAHDDLLSLAVYVALTDDDASVYITQDEKHELVLSAAIVNMLKQDGNVAVTLQDLYLAHTEGLPLVLPVLSLTKEDALPQIRAYYALPAATESINPTASVNTKDIHYLRRKKI